MAAAKRIRVKGAAAVLKTVDGGERYVYRGAVLDPAAFDGDSVKHAVSAGLVEKVTVEEQPEGTDTSGSGSDVVEIPGGDPVEAWTVPQVDAFAKREDLDLGSAKSKPEKIAAIVAALKEKRGQ